MAFVARLVSKTKSNDQEIPVHQVNRYDGKAQKIDLALQKGLVSLLLKKKVIGEEELLEEINRIKNDPSLSG